MLGAADNSPEGRSPHGQLKAVGSEGGLLGSGQVDGGVGHQGIQAAAAASRAGGRKQKG